MISEFGKGKEHVKEQAHRGTDDWGFESGRKAEDVARAVRTSKHTCGLVNFPSSKCLRSTRSIFKYPGRKMQSWPW